MAPLEIQSSSSFLLRVIFLRSNLFSTFNRSIVVLKATSLSSFAIGLVLGKKNWISFAPSRFFTLMSSGDRGARFFMTNWV